MKTITRHLLQLDGSGLEITVRMNSDLTIDEVVSFVAVRDNMRIDITHIMAEHFDGVNCLNDADFAELYESDPA